MTNEERNKKLKHLITCMKCEVSGKVCDENCPTQYEAGNLGEIIENLEAISEILEQQSCEDAISRQAVNDLVDELARAISDERLCMSRGRSTATIMRDILHLPSVTPKEKTGKWIKILNKRSVCIVLRCSECGNSPKHAIKSKYCPNCGSKMEVQE